MVNASTGISLRLLRPRDMVSMGTSRSPWKARSKFSLGLSSRNMWRKFLRKEKATGKD